MTYTIGTQFSVLATSFKIITFFGVNPVNLELAG